MGLCKLSEQGQHFTAVLPDSMFTQVLPDAAASQTEAFQIVVAGATASVRIYSHTMTGWDTNSPNLKW